MERRARGLVGDDRLFQQPCSAPRGEIHHEAVVVDQRMMHHVHALIADADFRAGDELPDLALRLAAEGAVEATPLHPDLSPPA